MPDLGFTTESYNDRPLIAGEYPRATKVVTLLAGTNYVAGTVLGRITANGKFTTSAAAAADGSETPIAILADDFDATGGDVQAPVYLTGEFNKLALTLGAGHTLASIDWGLAQNKIFLRDVVAGQ